MVVVQSKTETSASSSPLSIAPQKEGESSQGSLSFSELLRGASAQKDEKVMQNGTLVLSLAESGPEKKEDSKTLISSKIEKAESLPSLLKETEEGTRKELDIKVKESEKPVISLNPQVTQKISPNELKVLIKDAKEYLKDKIIQSEGFKKSEIAALPKTLKGLTQVAQKLGIDLSKISLEEVRKSVSTASRSEKLEDSPSEDEVKVKSKVPNETPFIEKNEKTKPLKTQQSSSAQQLQQVVQEDTEQKANPKAVQTTQTKIQETPLFQAQTKTEISTQEIVKAKTNVIELKKPKEKADDTLKLLLRTDKSAKSELGMTADFSVATARVIVSSTESSTTKGLESLLHGEKHEQSSVQGKLDGLNIAKADSFELKLNEAKQMIKYLSQDVKTAIEDYKAPFTRVKVQLNPQRLGEVDLTVIQRGKNLHISLNSNNAAINTLAMNANDLKVQLTNSGINNATLNFSNNPQSQDGSASQQQQNNHQQREEAHKEYNYFESEETNEEIVSSLEIVVPSYA
jgi:flagellar hook-length control protein FliK